MRLWDFDTGFTELGSNHKLGLKHAVRSALHFPSPPLIRCEGMASVAGNQAQNELLAAGRESSAEQYIYGLLLNRISLDDDRPDNFETSLADVGQPLDLRAFPMVTLPGKQLGRVVISTVPGQPARPVAILNGRADGSKRHQEFRAKTGGRDSLDDAEFRAVALRVVSAERPDPPPPVPIDPSAPKIFHFRMRVAPEQPAQPANVNKALGTALDVLKTIGKQRALKKVLEELQKRLPQLKALARAGDFIKYVKIALGALGVELIGFDIMDDQLSRGGRYVYFGLAPSTDIVVDVLADLIVNSILAFLQENHTLPLEGELEEALFALLAKLGLKDIVGRLKALLDLNLKPPFPFTGFTAASLPMVGIFNFDLDDFQGAFSEVREGANLTVRFEDGIGAQRAVNTSPIDIKLKTGSGPLSRRFGLTGVIAKGADIPFAA